MDSRTSVIAACVFETAGSGKTIPTRQRTVTTLSKLQFFFSSDFSTIRPFYLEICIRHRQRRNILPPQDELIYMDITNISALSGKILSKILSTIMGAKAVEEKLMISSVNLKMVSLQDCDGIYVL
jgi:hypothetical protein